MRRSLAIYLCAVSAALRVGCGDDATRPVMSGPQTWARSDGGPGDDAGTGVAADGSGNVIMAREFQAAVVGARHSHTSGATMHCCEIRCRVRARRIGRQPLRLRLGHGCGRIET
jgi:hypothetical protein